MDCTSEINKSKTIQTPVVLFIYNRPTETKKVFERIREVEPSKLYIVADGPVSGDEKDRQKCIKTRETTEVINWPAEVGRYYADDNLGLEERLQSGLNAVFAQEEEAIILEDDIVPSSSFFYFCQSLLSEYRGDERVLDVVGTNYLESWKSDAQDYHFSTIGSSWGWATWKNMWEKYDPQMKLWQSSEIPNELKNYYVDKRISARAKRLYEMTYNGEIETWHYQWGFLGATQSSYHIVPSKNLVSNIGFNQKGTHTKDESSPFSDMDRYDIEFPLQNRNYIIPDIEYSKKYYEKRATIWEKRRLLMKMHNIISSVYESAKSRQ